MLNIKHVSKVVGSAVCAAALFFGAIAQANTVELTAVADSVVLDGASSQNLVPGLLSSELNTSGAGSVWLSLLKFDLTGLANVQVNSARLELTTIFNHNSNAFSHQVFSSSDDNWSESTVNGLNRPTDASLTWLAAIDINGVSKTYSWNVLGGVIGADGLGGAGHELTLVVRPDLNQSASTFGPHFIDRTALSGVPKLSLDVSPVPEPASWWLLLVGTAFITRFARTKR
ncbi:MAG TPA: DNRLRE domain-containing protein [Cellvibrionaceae bacterium]